MLLKTYFENKFIIFWKFSKKLNSENISCYLDVKQNYNFFIVISQQWEKLKQKLISIKGTMQHTD